MKLKYWRYSILMISIILIGCSSDSNTLFQALRTADTDISFSNRITESEKYNVLEYEYIYNGGGVGVADFNQDGLEDVIFIGNMVANELYLNKGEMTFENVTQVSGVAAEEKWCSSVQVVDINHDGLPDIHITAMTKEEDNLRKNIMFVHQGMNNEGIPTFLDKAEEYGIADSGNNTTAAFFDYDNDGDLDLYLGVNKILDKFSPNAHRKQNKDGSSPIRDILYRNDDDGKKISFTDVSLDAGIIIGGFTLGVNTTDIDRDGFKDIYVTNDYLTNDVLYMNNGDGTFSDRSREYLKHTSYSAMGNDVADINNDGLMDVFALDMLPEDNYRRKTMIPNNNYTGYLNNERFGYQYQFMRNTLQINQGHRTDTSGILFSEVSIMSGVSSTDWSWAPMIADFDNDADKDIIVTNGFPKDVTDRDFIDYNSDKGSFVAQKDLLKKIPSVKVKNYAFRNDSKKDGSIPEFNISTEDWGITDPSFSNGAAYVDFDNDGDLDYVINNINDSAAVYQNFANDQLEENLKHWLQISFDGSEKNKDGIGVSVEIFHNGKRQYAENTPHRGYLSSVFNGLHFGLGQDEVIDKMIVRWHDRTQELVNVKVDQKLTLKYNEGSADEILEESDSVPLFVDVTKEVGINFIHEESDYTDYNVQSLLMHKLSQLGPELSVGDVNGDGLDDFYIGGSHFHKGRFFVQDKNGKFSMADLLPEAVEKDKMEEDIGSVFFDADGDGDQDLYVVSGGYEFELKKDLYLDRLYMNENGRYIRNNDALPNIKSSGSCVRAEDYDQDGDVDLFIGGRVNPYNYPQPVSSYILENNGKGIFEKKDIAALENIGMVCDAQWIDIDGDKDKDLVIVGEWMPVQYFVNDNGELSKNEKIVDSEGWWNSIFSGDFDEDGDLDFIVGNQGYNTLQRASLEQPVGLYYADFDDNGSVDIFPSAFFKDGNGELKEYPYFGLGDMQKEVIALKKQHKRHAIFANLEMSDIIEGFEDVDTKKLVAKTSASSIFINDGHGNYEMRPLPIEAQVAPVFEMVVGDFDGDSHLDIAAQNRGSMKVFRN